MGDVVLETRRAIERAPSKRIFILRCNLYASFLDSSLPEFDASALRFKRAGARTAPVYTTQKLNLLTGGTDKLFRGSVAGRCGRCY